MRERRPSPLRDAMTLCFGLCAAAFALDVAVRLIEAIAMPLLLIGGTTFALVGVVRLWRRFGGRQW